MLAGDIFSGRPAPRRPTRPKDVPFLHVQNGRPARPRVKGMRVLERAEAFAVNRSGGIQGRSRWQSAEILV